MSQLITHVGYDGFITTRDELRHRYHEALRQSRDDYVRTEHGDVGEFLVIDWLKTFLPKRYDVCKGYMITSSLQKNEKMEEWDVIIYDAIESPILFTRDRYGQEKRAIPIEYVRSIIEVKASFTPENAKKVVKKLCKLEKFIGKNLSLEYPSFLCEPFCCSAFFFKTMFSNFAEYRNALNHMSKMLTEHANVPFLGAFILESQKNSEHSGYLRGCQSDTPISFPEELEMSSEFIYPNEKHGVFGSIEGYHSNNYSIFLFDLLRAIQGRLNNRISSLYGLAFGNSPSSYLFH